MNEGKQDLERVRLQQMLEQSCWIINNERISLIWAYGIDLKIEAKFCHYGDNRLDRYQQGDKKLISPRG